MKIFLKFILPILVVAAIGYIFVEDQYGVREIEDSNLIVSGKSISPKRTSVERSDNQELLKFGWQKQKVYRYSLEYNAEGEGDLSAASDQLNRKRESVVTAVWGEAAIVVVTDHSENDGEYVLDFVIRPTMFSVLRNQKETGIRPEFIHSTIRVNREGAITSFHMKEDAFIQYGAIVRDLLSLIELPLPEAGKSRWRGMEQNFQTQIPVSFSFSNNLTGQEVTIQKRYEKNLVDQEVSGEFSFLFDNREGCLISVSGEKSHKTGANGRTVSKNRTTLNMELVSIGDVQGNDLIAMVNARKGGKQTSETLGGKTMFEMMRRKAHLDLLRGDNATDLLKKLDGTDPENSKEMTLLFQKLVALFLLHPESTAEFLDYLLDHDLREKSFSVLVSALINAGTPEAQRLFRNVIEAEEETEEAKKRHLITGLGFVENPDRLTESFVRDLAESSPNPNIRLAADYSMGSIAHFLRDDDKHRAKNILSDYSQKMETAPSEDGQFHYLTVVGNIGLEEQLEIVEPLLLHPSTKIRNKAYDALRFVDNDQARTHLMEALTSEDANLRRTAATALGYTPGNEKTIAVYKERLYRETDIDVLKSMLHNLGNTSGQYPESIVIIDDFLQKCGHRDLCDYAKSLRSTL